MKAYNKFILPLNFLNYLYFASFFASFFQLFFITLVLRLYIYITLCLVLFVQLPPCFYQNIVKFLTFKIIYS
jgi:hypothetical protein